MPEYPETVWQEAIINAFAHRDYEDQAREIEVWFFEDRLEVKSPGDLIPPITLEMLRSRTPVHASRNPLITRVLVEAGLMREEGEGIPRMFDEMERFFLRAPEFQAGASEFMVILHNEPVFTGPSEEWQRIVQELSLSTAQKRILLAHPEGFTNSDYQRLNSIDRDQAYREIQEMIGFGVILPAETAGRGAVYHVAPDLQEARAFLQARLPTLRNFFVRRPFLQNADYRKIFGVTRIRAVRELGRLVDSGYLVLEGRGRSARYTRGSELATPGENESRNESP